MEIFYMPDRTDTVGHNGLFDFPVMKHLRGVKMVKVVQEDLKPLAGAESYPQLKKEGAFCLLKMFISLVLTL